jgi:predicted nucleic acid-binding protein
VEEVTPPWDELPDGATVLIDSAPAIYYFEDHPTLADRFEPLFAAIQQGRLYALVTPVTLAEVVTGALKRGDLEAAARYRAVLTTTPGWSLRETDADIAMVAAGLCAQHRLRLHDAVQLATAIHTGCTAVATHDRGFPATPGLKVLGPRRKA